MWKRSGFKASDPKQGQVIGKERHKHSEPLDLNMDQNNPDDRFGHSRAALPKNQNLICFIGTEGINNAFTPLA